MTFFRWSKMVVNEARGKCSKLSKYPIRQNSYCEKNDCIPILCTTISGSDTSKLSSSFQAYRVQTDAEHDFSGYVLLSDKSTFTNKRIYNICNYHVSVASNIYVTLSELYKRRCTVNVLAGIKYTHLIGSYLVPSHLDEDSYLVLLWKMLSPLNPDLVNIRQYMWFQYKITKVH